MILYHDDCAALELDNLDQFFVGWPKAPNAAVFRDVMRRSARRLFAVDEDGRMAGYVNALSNGLTAFIPWLEVRPDRQGEGIGTELVRRVVASLDGHYGIDLCCDPGLIPYYRRLGFTGFAGAGLRFPAAFDAANASGHGVPG